MATFAAVSRVLSGLALVLALATGCRSGATEPDYRPSNPPPAPQYTPRALEQGGIGMQMSDEVEGDEAEALKREAEPDPEPGGDEQVE